jgi:hypothetical protein
MKTPEQVFEEWINDEILFDADLLNMKFTRKGFAEFCLLFHEGRRTGDKLFPSLDRVLTTRDEAREALRACGWEDEKVDAWYRSFLSAQNLSKYSGSDEVATALRLKAVEAREKMGWSATPYTI